LTDSTPPSIEQLSPRLDSLVRQQLGRIRQRFLIHGCGRMLLVIIAVALLYYVLDRGLLLPVGIRITLSICVAALLVLEFRRSLLYPLRRSIGDEDVAIVIERRFPELKERLISSLQLKDAARRGRDEPAALRNQSASMIEQLVRDTAAEIDHIPSEKVLDPRRTVRVWAGAIAIALPLVFSAATNPQAFGVFLRRALGAAANYPRLTTLRLRLDEESEQSQVERRGRNVVVTIADGADLAVLVDAEGTVPREVFLAVQGGRGMAPRVPMTGRGGGRFRYVFRRISAPFEFHAFGGDDDRGDLDVSVVTVRPPRVGTIQAMLTAPAYTGVEPATVTGGGMEALIGTQVRLELTATAKVREGTITFMESGRVIDLEPALVADDDGTSQVLRAEFTIERSDRYQVRLVSPDGLRNPHPGNYPVVGVTDQAPTGFLMLPADDDLSVVLPTGIVPIRAEARDDYGLTDCALVFGITRIDEKRQLELVTGAPPPAAPVRNTILTHLMEVATAAPGDARVSIGDSITVAARLTDNRQPDPQTTELPARQLHIVGEADLARRISGHFRRIRLSVDELLTSQRRLHEQSSELIAGAAGRSHAENRDAATRLQVGQSRIQGGARRVHNQLMRSFDLHLFNRLEESPHAARVLELYADYQRSHDDAAGQLPGFYSLVSQERREGRLGSMPKTLDPILDMTVAAGQVAGELSTDVITALDLAGVADNAADTQRNLAAAGVAQEEILNHLDHLHHLLDEWNVFQDVIIQTRSILEKQREVEARTRDSLRTKNEPRKK